METENTQENKKNILFIVQNASYPFDKRVSKEAVSLNKNGFKVFVISPTSVYDVESFSNIDGIEIHRFKNYLSNGSFIGFFLEYFISLIKIYYLSLFLSLKKKINVIHVANPPDFFWPLAIISKILRIKFIFDQHDLSPEMFNIRFSSRLVYRILTFNEKLTVALADSIITANNSFKRD